MMLSHTDWPVPYRLSKRCLHLASLTATIGNLRTPSRAIALSLITPVVVSSQPPMTSSARSGRLLWSISTRSPPSSIMILGLCSRDISMCLVYSSSVAPWYAKTLRPESASAAATSSCVERLLLPVTDICAPPAASTRQRYAVLASRCTERLIFLPSNGFVRLKSSSSARRSGMLFLTHSILVCPDGAREMSLMSYGAVWGLFCVIVSSPFGFLLI